MANQTIKKIRSVADITHVMGDVLVEMRTGKIERIDAVAQANVAGKILKGQALILANRKFEFELTKWAKKVVAIQGKRQRQLAKENSL